ncbi:unnamed protein product, partial [Linum tenue]
FTFLRPNYRLGRGSLQIGFLQAWEIRKLVHRDLVQASFSKDSDETEKSLLLAPSQAVAKPVTRAPEHVHCFQGERIFLWACFRLHVGDEIEAHEPFLCG